MVKTVLSEGLKTRILLGILFTFLQKRATLMRRSTVLGRPLQIVFSASYCYPPKTGKNLAIKKVKKKHSLLFYKNVLP